MTGVPINTVELDDYEILLADQTDAKTHLEQCAAALDAIREAPAPGSTAPTVANHKAGAIDRKTVE